MPSAFESTIKTVKPVESPFSPDVLARTINRSELVPSMTKVFLPDKRYSSLLFLAINSLSYGL